MGNPDAGVTGRGHAKFRRSAALAPGQSAPPPVQVVQHRGHTTKEIAAELFVSVKTVERHVSVVKRKLGVRSRWWIGHDPDPPG